MCQDGGNIKIRDNKDVYGMKTIGEDLVKIRLRRSGLSCVKARIYISAHIYVTYFKYKKYVIVFMKYKCRQRYLDL